MTSFTRLLAAYGYELPRSRIALKPATPRDSAKLQVYNRRTGAVTYDTFRNLGKHLPQGTVLVFNETKVLPARFTLRKATGGKVEALYLGSSRSGVDVLLDRAVPVNSTLSLGRHCFTVVGKRAGQYQLRPSFALSQLPRILARYGVTPLPPYLKHSPLSEATRRKMYQTVFARRSGSVAAPTASLHFTSRLLQALRRQGIATAFITLHVNLGTFAPLTEAHVRQKILHSEPYEIAPRVARQLSTWRKQGRPIIAVGTTVARTLESAAVNGTLRRLSGQTKLFISPGYRWKFVSGLVTNYHVPRSSLMMLVAALTGREKLLDLYAKAQRRGFRFFSFGDGMLVR